MEIKDNNIGRTYWRKLLKIEGLGKIWLRIFSPSGNKRKKEEEKKTKVEEK